MKPKVLAKIVFAVRKNGLIEVTMHHTTRSCTIRCSRIRKAGDYKWFEISHVDEDGCIYPAHHEELEKRLPL